MTKEGIEQLKRHEGLRLIAYKDTVDVWTVGYGHTAGVKEGDVIFPFQAEFFLADDIAIATADALKLLPELESYSARRQDAVVNLSFNLGYTSLSKFHTFLRCMKAHEYKGAASSLVLSKWYGQVGTRAKEIVQMIREG